MPDDRKALMHALALVGQLGWWMIVPIVGGLLLGLALDRWLSTGALFAILLTIAGVLGGAWQSWRVIRRCL